MIQWIKNIKSLLSLSRRIGIIESEITEMECKFKGMYVHYGIEFEKKIQQMTFDYTKNLDDTKSDYLKRYLEVRVDCMQNQLTSLLPGIIKQLKENVDMMDLRLERLEENEEHE